MVRVDGVCIEANVYMDSNTATVDIYSHVVLNEDYI